MSDLTISDHYIGVVLAAGFGTRLKPLTDHIPKPLLEFCGLPTLSLALNKFEALGLKRVGINSHHFVDQITNFIDNQPFNIDINLSIEKDKILGSGGAYPSFNSYRQGKSILAANGDVISDLNLESLINFHEEKKSVATMALLPFENKKGNSVWVDENNSIVDICPKKPRTAVRGGCFSGFQILSNEILEKIPSNQESNILDYYRDYSKLDGKIYASFHDCFWHDLGIPKDYLEAFKDFFTKIESQSNNTYTPNIGVFETAQKYNLDQSVFLKNKDFNGIEVVAPVLITGTPELAPKSKFGPFVSISSDCKVEEGCEISHSFLINGASVNSSNKISHRIQTEFSKLDLD